MKDTTYNGHRSWNAWNINLWITSNDESTYNFALACLTRAKNNPGRAARYFLDGGYRGTKTPDGARFNQLSVKETMKGLI
jgi:hypothetical protein